MKLQNAGREPEVWAIYDSQGIYETRDTESECQKFCEHYNARDVKLGGGLAPYTYKALYSKEFGEVVVTTNQDGHIVAVTRQDEDGVILSVLAMSEPIYKPEEKIAGYQVWWRLDGQVLDQLFENKERAESYVACIKSNAEVRTLYYKS